MTVRSCAWCGGPIPSSKRRDSVCCSTRCRQARHRLTTSVGRGVVGGHPLRLAYADPPYLGRCRLYDHFHPDGRCWDDVDTHLALIDRLVREFPDGWALSLAADSLHQLLPLCPTGSRVAAWTRGERPNRRDVVLNGWEPVIYFGGRRDRGVVEDLHDASRSPVNATRRDVRPRRVDVLNYRPGTRSTDPARVIGAKPADFCRWVFDLLGAEPQDDFTDVYAGSGGVARAWAVFADVEADAATSTRADVARDA